jgi:hypothetical protein
MLYTAATPAYGQAFADQKTALVDYSKADIEPHKACEALGKFKSKEIAQIRARRCPPPMRRSAHCRVTGLLSPEIAFEVSLPAKWNGRFYMIGNGGHAGEAMDDPGRVAQRNAGAAARVRLRADQHRSRRAQGAGRNLRAQQPAKGHRLRLARRAPHGHNHQGHHEDYYGKSVSHAYWNSCSNGGRQGLIEASAFPTISTASWPTRRGSIRRASRSAPCGTRKRLSEAPVTPAKLAMVGR